MDQRRLPHVELGGALRTITSSTPPTVAPTGVRSDISLHVAIGTISSLAMAAVPVVIG